MVTVIYVYIVFNMWNNKYGYPNIMYDNKQDQKEATTPNQYNFDNVYTSIWAAVVKWVIPIRFVTEMSKTIRTWFENAWNKYDSN